MPDAATWPVSTLGSIGIPFGFLVAVGRRRRDLVLYTRTRFGFEVQVIGDSPRAARYAGMRTRRKIVAIMALSGAVAGHRRCEPVGRLPARARRRGPAAGGLRLRRHRRGGARPLNPIAVVFVALLIGGLQNAGYALQGADFPAGLVGMMQGLILFAMLGGELFVQLPDHAVTTARAGRQAADAGAAAA